MAGKGISRLTVFIFNICIALLSVAAIVSCFLDPLLRVKIEYRLTAEKMEEMLGEDAESIDIEEIIGEGIPLSISFGISPSDAFDALSAKDKVSAVERTIENNIDDLIDQLTPTLDEIAKQLMRTELRRSVRQVIRQQVKNILQITEPFASDERVDELLLKAGITDEYITNVSDDLLNSVYEQGATVDGIGEKAADRVEEVFGMLEESGEPAFFGATLAEPDREDVKEEVSDALSLIADDNGEINTGKITSAILLSLLKSVENNEEGGSEGKAADGKFLLLSSEENGGESGENGAAVTDGEESDGEDAREELKKEIKSMLLEKIPESTAKTIVKILQVIGVLLIFTCFTWAYLILKMLVKLATKNPAIKLKLPIWLGWLPALLFFLLPKIALLLVRSQSSIAKTLLGAEILASTEKFFAVASLGFTSATWVTFAAALLLVILSVPYSVFRRRLKKG